jgi:hypothetical protein
MKSLSKYYGEELILTQPSFFKREYVFRSANELLAKMCFPKFFSMTAVVDGFGEKYEIIRPSIWKSEIAIKKFGYDLPFATLRSLNLFRTKGEIDFQNGKKILLKFGAFKKSCQVFSQSEELLLLFQNKLSLKDKNSVTIQNPSELIDENPWVIMLIWYLILENRRRNSAAR